jgi:hypothetical protein
LFGDVNDNVISVELSPAAGDNVIPGAAGVPGGRASTEISPATSNTSMVAASTVPTAARSRSQRRVFGEFVCIVGTSFGVLRPLPAQRRVDARSIARGMAEPHRTRPR